MKKIDLRKMLLEKINEKQVTQKELSKNSGVTEAKISNYLNNKSEIRTDTFERLYNADTFQKDDVTNKSPRSLWTR